jgi:hypothetical protein
MAKMDIPRGVLPLKELAVARQTAVAEQEAVVFLKVDLQSKQSHVQEAVEEYVRRFKRYGPVVLVPKSSDDAVLPEEVAEAFSSLGGSYPRLVVMDPDDDSIIVKVPYLAVTKRKEELKAFRRTIHRYLQEKKRRPRVPPSPPQT